MQRFEVVWGFAEHWFELIIQLFELLKTDQRTPKQIISSHYYSICCN